MSEYGWRRRSKCLTPEAVRKTLGWESGCCFFTPELSDGVAVRCKEDEGGSDRGKEVDEDDNNE